MKALDEILVLIPCGDERMRDFSVCSVGDLVRELSNTDSLVEAIDAAAIDGPFSPSESLVALERMRKSNAAPDFCYWEPEL